MIWQSLLHPRESIACIYNDIFIGLAKGIQAEGAISEELKVKWKEESEEKIRTLYAQWEKPQQAERAQKEYVAVQKDNDVFPAPVMMEPMPIKAATLFPAGIKQIQLDLAEIRKHMAKWESEGEVYRNLTYLKKQVPRSQWAQKEKETIQGRLGPSFLHEPSCEMVLQGPGELGLDLAPHAPQDCPSCPLRGKAEAEELAPGMRRSKKWERTLLDQPSTPGPLHKGGWLPLCS